mgnify:CR=1 FL=1
MHLLTRKEGGKKKEKQKKYLFHQDLEALVLVQVLVGAWVLVLELKQRNRGVVDDSFATSSPLPENKGKK